MYKFADNNHVYNEYESKINNVLNKNSLNFLSDTIDVGVFGVDTNFGKLYCKQISTEFPELAKDISNKKYDEEIDKFLNIGNQSKFYSEELTCYMTGNAARYIYHAKLISNYIKERFNDTPIDIIEMGGGYGGLCYWMRLFLQPIENYTIVDLPSACKLQQTCLSILNTKCNSITDSYACYKSGRPLFVISNYGYSEFDQHYQELYKNTILRLADGGFMVWNNWSGIFMFTDLPMKIESERPNFPDLHNKFIYF